MTPGTVGREDRAGSGSPGDADPPRSSPVDAVVLDLGNVVVRWDPYAPFADVLSRAETETLFEEIDFFAINRAQDAGRSWGEARADVAARFPGREWVVDHYVAHFPRALPGPVPGTAAVIEALRRTGVRVFGLTNFATETYPHAPRIAPAIGLLEDVLVSGEVGLVKPDPAIYAVAAERFGLDPARTVFVDDTPANVDAATAFGMHGVLFTGAPALVRALARLGLDEDGLLTRAVGDAGTDPARA